MSGYKDWVHERLMLAENAIYCKNDTSVSNLISLIEDDEYAGIDTETANSNPYYEAFDPLLPGAFLRLIQIESDDQIVVFDLMYLNDESKLLIREYLENPNRVLIFQNAKFDMKWLKVHLGIKKFHKVYCTMLGSQTNSGGKVQWGHSLKEQVFKEFDYELEKELGASNWLEPNLTEAQIQYAVKDTIFLRMLRQVQVEKIKKNKLVEIAEIEFNCNEAYAHMEMCGFKINKKRWLKIAERNRLRAIRMESKISNFLAPNAGLFKEIPTFKVSSDKQLKNALKNAGYEIPTKYDNKTDSHKETIQKDFIEKLIERDALGKPKKKFEDDIWQMMYKYSALKQAYTFYGENWTDKIHPLDGRIHPDIFIYGTETGRNAFKKPNFQQIPTENIFRNCFIPEDDSVLIGADYNGAELRILAQESADEVMCDAFNKGMDLHTYTASIIFKVPYDSPEVGKNSIFRARAKNLNFGIIYGIGAKRFAKNADMSEEEAHHIINEYFRLYKGLKKWLDEAKYKARVERVSRSLGGRMFRHTFDENNKGQVALAERNGCNFPIQAGNADIMKLALHYIYEEIYERQKEFQYFPKLVNAVHDEIVSEVHKKDAKKMKELQHRNMVKAGEYFIKRVPVLVDIDILDKWKK